MGPSNSAKVQSDCGISMSALLHYVRTLQPRGRLSARMRGGPLRSAVTGETDLSAAVLDRRFWTLSRRGMAHLASMPRLKIELAEPRCYRSITSFLVGMMLRA